MSCVSDDGSLEAIATILARIRRKGVRVWTQRGALRYRAPKGALSEEEKVALGALSARIAAFLERAVDERAPPPVLERRRPGERIPLTVPQLSHWHAGRLYERPTWRSIASATRLCGPLAAELLQDSLDSVVQRHEALRSRVMTLEDGTPVQEVAGSGRCELGLYDCRSLSEAMREAQVQESLHKLIQEPIDVLQGPLFSARLIRLRDDEHIVLTVMEHMFSDAFSRGILLRDLFTTYLCAVQGHAPELPPIRVQFADYAVWQGKLKRHQATSGRHAAYWRERLDGYQRLRFPRDGVEPDAERSAWGREPLVIDSELKTALREWCRHRCTTLVMAVFTAFVALVLRWCGGSRGIIGYQSDGRSSPLVENTIGYFATVLNLSVELRQEDTFLDLLGRVTQEYCAAHEHVDAGDVPAPVAHSELMRCTGFNWVPIEANNTVAKFDASRDLLVSPVPFADPVVADFDADYEPSVLLVDKGDCIAGTVSFPRSRFSAATMASFSRGMLAVLRELMRDPHARVSSVPLPDSR